MWLELLAFLMSLVFFQKWKNSKLHLFMPFLALTVLVEWGSKFGIFVINNSNHWIYNVFTPIEFTFYLYFFYIIINNNVIRKGIRIGWAIFFAFAILNISFFQTFWSFNSYTYTLGSIEVIFCCCLYLIDLMRSRDYVNLAKYPYFWVCTGVIFFYLGSFASDALFEFIRINNKTNLSYLTRFIIDSLNVILYSCFIIAFLCPVPKIQK